MREPADGLDRLQIIQGDITVQEVDAIVNAANSSLLGGSGVDGAIHRAAGPELYLECRTLNGCRTGEAKLTGGHRLKARYVIHTVGPMWWGAPIAYLQSRFGHSPDELLARCYRNCFRLVEGHSIRSLAFPSISTGVYNFPVRRAARIALTEMGSFFTKNTSVEKVVIVCYTKTVLDAYKLALAGLSSKQSKP
jgi:O-acetyl-ADP-ribose deacetylase